jgi:hypothetical protein
VLPVVVCELIQDLQTELTGSFIFGGSGKQSNDVNTAKEWTPPTYGAPPPAPPGADPAMAGGNPMQHSQPPPHYPQQGMGQPGTLWTSRCVL